ncbi:MAG TPA: fatty acid--CoA ligase family protein, partial [Mycobacterium sp.]|nr:fatty acid--CoA ligase family protein [Mycobacterium sp.]
MSISLLLEMAVASNPDRTAVVSRDTRLTTQELSDLADGGAGVIAGSNANHVVYVGTGGAMLPLLIFASARAGLAFTPINYRLSAEGIQALVGRLPEPLVVVDSRYRDMLGSENGGAVQHVIDSDEFLAAARDADPAAEFADPDAVAIVLFTSGTTSQPKAVELTHNNLTSYITGSVEFDSAEPTDAALICVPPYHVAGVSAALSNLYAGRKMVYLPTFDPQEWVRLINAEHVTTATVVPTMLDRIVTVLEGGGHELPSLRNLAYGGSKVGLPLVRRALELLPEVGFVNAYGLTETSSTIAVLTPDDHRLAQAASDTAVVKRLGSVGQPVPGIELQIRDENGTVLGPGQTGELFVRGEQVSGRYTGIGSVLDAEGWFPTRDIATLDDDGYLFIGGRSDDTIIRGGENIAPAELEDVLIEHAHVRDVAVVGIEDPQWGQAIVAVVVPAVGTDPDPEELREHVRKSLRGSRTP